MHSFVYMYTDKLTVKFEETDKIITNWTKEGGEQQTDT
jgi:hypothetical protein